MGLRTVSEICGMDSPLDDTKGVTLVEDESKEDDEEHRGERSGRFEGVLLNGARKRHERQKQNCSPTALAEKSRVDLKFH